MSRLIACDRMERNWFDVDWDALSSASFREVVNGEHSIDLETTQAIDEGTRLLWKDGMEKWHEWAIDEVDTVHALGDATAGTYGGTWSMQYDLATVSGGEIWVSSTWGDHNPITAGAALSLVLETQSRWEVGNVTVATTGACSLYDGSVWEYLGKLVETFGGEMEPRIVVQNGRVVHRYVDWLAHVGTEAVTRRFDFGEDCTEIRRTEPAGPRYCRIVPRCGSVKTDADGVDYTARTGIEDDEYVPTWTSPDGELSHVGGTAYIEDLVAAANFDNGTHPEKVVIYDADDDEELFELAVADITNHTRPQSTYTATVRQFARAGLDPHGVALGDEVHVVDSTFGDAPMRLEVRVTERTVNMLDESDVELVIGPHMKTLAMAFEQVREEAKKPIDEILAGGTLLYVEKLLDAINQELNTVGGWKYEVAGQGTYTYDVQVSDPPIGTGATRCVHVGGGFIRFAMRESPASDWSWTNVITPEGYCGLAATIARITAGFIGNASNGSYWDLDNNRLRIGGDSEIGDGERTMGALVNGVWVNVIGLRVRTQWAQSDSDAPNAYASEWLTTPPAIAPGNSLWKRDEVSIITTVGSVVVYRNFEKAFTSASLLPNSDEPTINDIYYRNASVTDGVITLHASDGNASHHAMWRSTALDYASLEGHKLRLTFEARTTDGSSATVTIRFAAMDTTLANSGYFPDEVTVRRGRYTRTVSTATFKAASKIDLTVPDWANAENTEADVTDRWITVDFSVPEGTGDVEIRNVTLLDRSVRSYTGAEAQYYLSTSPTSRTGGEWLATAPAWEAGKYYWTRAALSYGSGSVRNTTPNAITVSDAISATESAGMSSEQIQALGEGLTWTRSELTMAIRDAARSATDYLTYRNGKLILGATDSAIRNVMTNQRTSFERNGMEVAWFGHDSEKELWQMFIPNAQITEMLHFGDFAWIARANMNMSLKWIGG